MRLGRRRMLLAIGITAVVLTGGTAFAASGPGHAGMRSSAGINAADTVDPSSSTTDSSTPESDTTDTTDTSASTSTSTSTSVSTDTTVPMTATTTADCKPGWGYGDTNHCHSGPPGLAHKPDHPNKPGKHQGRGHH